MTKQNKQGRSNVFFIPIGMLGVLALAGCATTAPTAEFAKRINPQSAVRAGDTAKTVVDVAPGVQIYDYEKARLTQVIEGKIATEEIRSKAAGQARVYEVDVKLVQYERGNSFARAMLAGLGQIHIAGDVTIYLMPARTKIGEFTIKKTFAWGGIYGGMTTMETVEQGFAGGIAAAVTGQSESDQDHPGNKSS